MYTLRNAITERERASQMVRVVEVLLFFVLELSSILTGLDSQTFLYMVQIYPT